MFGFLLVRFFWYSYFCQLTALVLFGGGRIVEKSPGTLFYYSPANFQPITGSGELTGCAETGRNNFSRFYSYINFNSILLYSYKNILPCGAQLQITGTFYINENNKQKEKAPQKREVPTTTIHALSISIQMFWALIQENFLSLLHQR